MASTPPYTAKNFESLLGTPGFSDTLLKKKKKVIK
jgi:hypothetical protein